MASIRKIALTPLKWVSKKAVHATLLRFPGGEKSQVACVYCPEMCRFSCPTAVARGDDTVTPRSKMSLLYEKATWPQAFAGPTGPQPLWPIYDCTGCGRCTSYCVYEMPVRERLFAARAAEPWGPAREAAAALTDAEDPCGDLAHELGDEAQAVRRRAAWVARNPGLAVGDPKQWVYLREHGRDARFAWREFLAARPGTEVVQRLMGSRWLWAESVWWARSGGAPAETAAWLQALGAAGVEVVLPFETGPDAQDAGGEGAYARVFATSAAVMARSFWERDRHRADAILCMSRRQAEHFSRVLPEVPVVSAEELAGKEGVLL